jgi:hypothetical protein
MIGSLSIPIVVRLRTGVGTLIRGRLACKRVTYRTGFGKDLSHAYMSGARARFGSPCCRRSTRCGSPGCALWLRQQQGRCDLIWGLYNKSCQLGNFLLSACARCVLIAWDGHDESRSRCRNPGRRWQAASVRGERDAEFSRTRYHPPCPGIETQERYQGVRLRLRRAGRHHLDAGRAGRR